MIPYLGRYPDNEAWQSEDGYSYEISALLIDVYGILADETTRPSKARMTEARSHLADALLDTCSLSPHQRFALISMDAQLALADARGECAKDVVDRAFQLARGLRDHRALAECYFLNGWLHQRSLEYVSAARSFQKAAALLKRVRRQRRCGDLAFELRALSQLAMYRFLLAEYEEAERLIEEGKSLSERIPERDTRTALTTLLWVRALVQRWRGNLETALACAFNAADLLATNTSDPSFGRIQCIAGEIALDIAERYCAEKPAHGRATWLSIAYARIKEARSVAGRANDSTGRGLADLARVRYERMTYRRSDRLEIIKATLARASNDATLACQMETALGREHEASGDHLTALDHYRRAMNIVREYKVKESSLAPAFLVWPQRELLRSQEMEPSERPSAW